MMSTIEEHWTVKIKWAAAHVEHNFQQNDNTRVFAAL